jgi:uncharacterized protein (TIGR03435 family)
MRNPANKTCASRKSLTLTTAAVVALALPVVAGMLTTRRLQAQTPQAPAIQLALAPPASGRPKFEVASIKVNKSSNPADSNFPLGIGDDMRSVGGLFSVTHMSLRGIVAFAYKLTGNIDYVVSGLPSWLDSEHFDIEAKAEGNPTKDQFRLMVQSLLADRFKLSMHHETREIPVFALVLSKPGKTGPQLTPHTDDATCLTVLSESYPSSPAAPLPPVPCGTLATLQASRTGTFRIGGRGVPLQMLASSLVGAQSFERPLVDQTGLTGTFDFWLEWSPQTVQTNGVPVPGVQSDPMGPSLQEAVRDQLGLKQEPQKVPVDVLVIDHIEQPSPN